MSIGIIGAGAFGSALAVSLGAQSDVILWGRALDPSVRASPRLPDHPFPKSVRVTADFHDALGADLCLIATSMAGLEDVSEKLRGKACPPLTLCCKGISNDSFAGPATALAARLPEAQIAMLTGPSFAVDIAGGLPTALTLAGPEGMLAAAQAKLSTNSLRIYTTTDVVGAELGGAMKKRDRHCRWHRHGRRTG